MNAMNSLSITEKDLEGYLSDAQAYLDNARQRVLLGAGRTTGSFVGSQTTTDSVSISKLVSSINPEDPLLSDVQLHTLRSIRRGAQIGLHLAQQYRQRSGASEFESAHGLTDAQKTELNEKMQTAAVVTLWTFARYVIWDMRMLTADNSFVGNIPASYDNIDIAQPRSSIMSVMYYLGTHLQKEINGSDDRLVAAVYSFALAVEETILNRVTGLKHLEPFTSVAYALEETDFSVNGFEQIDLAGSTSVEFNRVELGEIVGNRDAKHFARRLVERTLCYNFDAGANVFTKLGGLAPVWMGYGKPGTGKSMLIAATATLFKDYCDHLGIPFHFHPLPDNIIDSYQGNSAKNMVAWMKASHDPGRIVFMPVDDAENILEDRTRQGVSEGVRAAIGVFLRFTEGAYAINRGNATIGVFTNLPEQIDSAVRSRIQGRMVINGADSVEDAYDQDHLWFRKFANQDGFINLQSPPYEYMSAQQLLTSLGEAEQTASEPSHTTAKEIFGQVMVNHNPLAHEFFAHFYMSFMERFPTFSSRDIRNIQSAVSARIMDFDLPTEWFKSPEIFCRLDIERQEQMVLELRNANMKGLSFAEVYLQELVRYVDNYAAIADAEFDREVESQLKQQRVQQAVLARLKS